MARHRPRHLSARARAARTRRRAATVGAVAAITVGGALVVTAFRSAPDATSLAAGAASTTTIASTTSTTAATTTTAPPRRATMAFGGDVLIHSPVWEAARTDGGFDFSPMLAPIAPQLSAADLALCHLEVTLAREGEALSSFPRFRAPAALATDLAEAGFDGCSVASNHALDFGEGGVAATLDALDAAGVRHAGTARSPEEDRAPILYDVGGIRVAHLSYAYGFNGFSEPAGKDFLVDQIDGMVILRDAADARAAGAELVVVSLHWGNEYQHDVIEAQQVVADALAAHPGAVDLVVGHHAHVVQPISKVGSMWVVWGMGNLLSNNAPSCCPEESTDGVIVTATIGDRPAEQGGGVGVLDLAFTPTWNERTTFQVLPVVATLEAGATEPLASDLRGSFTRTAGHVWALGAEALGVAPDRPLP